MVYSHRVRLQKKQDNYLTDYHLHSTFSPDAQNSLEEMCQHALKVGFKEIAFTEHMEWQPDWRERFDVTTYLKWIADVKTRFIH